MSMGRQMGAATPQASLGFQLPQLGPLPLPRSRHNVRLSFGLQLPLLPSAASPVSQVGKPRHNLAAPFLTEQRRGRAGKGRAARCPQTRAAPPGVQQGNAALREPLAQRAPCSHSPAAFPSPAAKRRALRSARRCSSAGAPTASLALGSLPLLVIIHRKCPACYFHPIYYSFT